MEQSLINFLLGAVCLMLGAVLKTVWDGVKDLQKADASIALRVGAVEVLVAGNYVTRTELSQMNDAIFKKLDRIEMKVDGKVDK